MRSDQIIILLGAGASCEAKLASSFKMTQMLEECLQTDRELKEFCELYRAVKAAIVYGHGLSVMPNETIAAKINIEELVNVLNELVQCKKHVIYPFVASWNMELIEYAGKNFEKVKQFKDHIVSKLVSEWINLQNDDDAAYYKGLLEFANSCASSLRVFSLNYDMCVECGCGSNAVYRGFELDTDGVKVWDDRNMQTDKVKEPITLYKLHGSMDWLRDDKGRLYYNDHVNVHQCPDKFELIFGTSNKMRYEDPYLYLLSAFRKYALDAKLIICIGYSFNDSHINKILEQAARRNAPYLVSVDAPSEDQNKALADREDITRRLKFPDSHIECFPIGARKFMTEILKSDFPSRYVHDDNEIPF